MEHAQRPNILLIQSDQHRYDCTGMGGHPFIRTPALDGLAREGVWFTHAFTPSPICCPARQSLLCGLWPEQHGGLWNYGGGLPLPPFEQATWTAALRDAGYRLGHVGKWQEHPTRGPAAFGFSDVVPTEAYGAWRRSAGLPELRPEGWRWFGGVDPVAPEQTRPFWLAARAVGLLERYAAGSQPWHLRLNFDEPHLPCYPAAPYAQLYHPDDVPPWGNAEDRLEGKPYIQRQQRASWGLEAFTWRDWSVYVARYLAIITQIDAAIGLVLDALERLGLADSTLVIYTADHGDACGSHGLIDKHYTMYDELVRVPLVVRWPGVATRGTVSDAMVTQALDLAATMCEVAGLPVPHHCQGRSLVPILRGDTPADWPQEVVATYSGAQFGLYTQRMLRDRHWKYVWNPTDVDELYYLVEDPWEVVTRAPDPAWAHVLSDMRARLYERLRAQGDPLVGNESMRRQLVDGHKLPR
ncbi:MAG TPA: sulfatase-like hydrolase/transferase [Chloroflexi bacterium]|nr:sulfatase-like hydrolase/transferase [Chloroflexota bacterium]